jgi:hypothetical protein
MVIVWLDGYGMHELDVPSFRTVPLLSGLPAPGMSAQYVHCQGLATPVCRLPVEIIAEIFGYRAIKHGGLRTGLYRASDIFCHGAQSTRPP